jgi:hypothetical protein
VPCRPLSESRCRWRSTPEGMIIGIDIRSGWPIPVYFTALAVIVTWGWQALGGRKSGAAIPCRTGHPWPPLNAASTLLGGRISPSPPDADTVAQPRRRRADAAMAAHIAAGLLSAPVQRWQHGQVRAPDSVQRGPHAVASGVQALVEAHSIGDAELTSAGCFYRDYVHGIEGVRETERMGGNGGAFNPHVVQLARCKAVSAHRAIAKVIGPDLTICLVAFVVEDMSFAAMQRRFAGGAVSSCGRTEMSTTMKVLLVVLTGLYGAIDQGCRNRAA